MNEALREREAITWPVDYELVELDALLLGHASTNFNDRSRWTEIAIYKNGKGYTVCGNGMSVVFHLPICEMCPRNIDLEPFDGGAPCEKCNPVDQMSPEGSVIYEVDRAWAHDCDSAWEVIDACRQVSHQDSHGSAGNKWFVSRVSVQALKQAARKDSEIKYALKRTMDTYWMGDSKV